MKYLILVPAAAVIVKCVYFVKFCFKNKNKSAAVSMIVLIATALCLIFSDIFL